jgi:chromosome segregation protein
LVFDQALLQTRFQVRIKKIELIGFKSFKDKTVIQFDAGITGIVGPNGCGKSNIVDALLWAMGEMSAKDLRGSSMQDVIFAGAEGFAPAGMAEVSLTLENDGGPFPIKYQRFSEIMVTRRLHRSGESEYFINKEPARLRDIQEIFMDTGAGAKGFSIIQQGMISRIITSKPEEKRMLIEEAAGITKFKARKKESERKLQQTDQNLTRLADIVSELQRQMDHLKRQAEKAEKYRSIKQELESVDLKLAAKSYHEIQNEMSELEQFITTASDQEASLQSQMAQGQAELEQLKFQAAQYETQYDEHMCNIQAKQSELQKLELDIQRLEFDIEQAKTRGELTGSQMEIFQHNLSRVTEELSRVSDEYERVNLEVQELKVAYSAHSSRYQEFRAQEAALEEQITSSRQRYIALSQAENQIEAKKEALQSQREDLAAKVTETREVLDELEANRQEYRNKLEEAKSQLAEQESRLSQEKREWQELQVRQQEIEQQARDAKKEWESWRQELAQVQTRLETLEKLEQSMEGFGEGVKKLVQWRKAQVHGLSDASLEVWPTLSQVIEVDPQYEAATVAALDHYLQVLLARQEEDILSAAQFLKSQSAGRASFMASGLMVQVTGGEGGSPLQEPRFKALSNVVKVRDEYQQVLQPFLSQVAVASDLSAALEGKRRYPAWSFVTEQGDLIDEHGIVTIQSGASSASQVLVQRTKEIKELSWKKEELQGKLALAAALVERLQREQDELVTLIRTKREALTQVESQVTECQRLVSKRELELSHAETAWARMEKELQRLMEQDAQWEQKIAELEAKATEIAGERDELQTEIAQSELVLKELQAQFAGLQEEVTQLQVRLAQQETHLGALATQKQRLEQEKTKLESDLGRMGQESHQLGQKLTESQVLLEDKKSQFQRETHAFHQMKEMADALKDQYEVAHTEAVEFEARLRTQQSELYQLSQKATEHKLQLEQIRMREQVLLEQIRERYMLDLTHVWQQYWDEHLNVPAAQAQVKELKERLSRMGEVNLGAIEEYREISTRYEFLANQQKDLIDAKEQLKRVIDRIDKICSRRFQETFEQVNERFKKVFPVLFGGGEAYLQLVENPEKGEVGMDIIARPPGKKLQNVSLMSGGEKALTAVSLVFAIFLVKPSPYCLLDEVDAPLDDANVSRFNDLVREMAKRSQIIVVTHNKHTMSIAGKLNGVTMQNKGVSTMVSVNLEDVGA